MGISRHAYHSWQMRYIGLGLNELRELQELFEENREHKGILAGLTLDMRIL